MRKYLIALIVLLSVSVVQAQSDEPDAGQIAYIGKDYNVYVINPNNGESLAMTSDASTTRQYQWPTWSTDGRLAYFGMSVQDEVLGFDIFIAQDALAEGELVYNSLNEVFQYAYWSPQDCPGTGCRDLAVLLSGDVGLQVKLVRNEIASTAQATIGTGVPFYYSWSPDGNRMLWQRNQELFEIYDVMTNSVVETLPEKPGLMQAPAWSPVDDRLLFAALEPETDTTSLVISGHDALVNLASELNGLVSFAWSPNGNYVAYRVQTGPAAFGGLFVVDAVTGEIVARSPVTGVISFFWSPDGNRIAYVTLGSGSGSFNASLPDNARMASVIQQPGLTWSVLDIPSGANRRFSTFMPTREMLYLFQYFDQFSQSHRIWSADSKHILYSEITTDGPILSLLDVTRTDSIPFTLTAGVIGVWSFN